VLLLVVLQLVAQQLVLRPLVALPLAVLLLVVQQLAAAVEQLLVLLPLAAVLLAAAAAPAVPRPVAAEEMATEPPQGLVGSVGHAATATGWVLELGPVKREPKYINDDVTKPPSRAHSKTQKPDKPSETEKLASI
jgi:hypothetical protein